MKRVVLAGLGMVALAASAEAADLPRRYDASTADYVPVNNWTGFYIGINGGGAWGDSKWTSIGTFDVTGGMVGGTVGYNWQLTQWVFGLEGDVDWTNINGTSNAVCSAGCTTSNSWLATVRGRIGYAFDRFLPYITGGLAIGDIKASQPGFPAATTPTPAGQPAAVLNSSSPATGRRRPSISMSISANSIVVLPAATASIRTTCRSPRTSCAAA